ncbi:MAG TPA: ATP-binding protein [Candidatus Polarisedimenticolia bacterium]|nr:ATP-binding protein [Candidatus Polarisedimenticolia bacterium]
MSSVVRDLRIGTKLTLMVLTLMALTLGMLFFTYEHYEKLLVDMVQNQTEDLSKALEISVQQLTSRGQTDKQLLQDYVQRLSARGVTEISILSTERLVLASSNQAKVGTRVHPPRRGTGKPLVITGTIGDDEDSDKKISYNLDIPIIIDDQKQGYVRLHIILDDFAALLHSIHLKRILATSLIFLAGVAGSLALAHRMTSPLLRLTLAAERVASGDLDAAVPVESRDEIGKLQGNFNRMLEKLRENRRLESQLRRAERAAAIGRLASAVAHEIRNPLNYVSLSVDHLRTAFPPGDGPRAAEFERSVAEIKEELHRVNGLVTDFLNFGRPPRLRVQSCRVEEIFQEVLRLTSARASQQGIAANMRVDPGLPTLRADPEGLRTCFLNLVSNAIQAMPRGGRLELEASRMKPDVACLKVRDDGIGISDVDLERIFEPYFSTKEAGVGLGLAITQRIVQEHGGRIEVVSRVGEGTEFQIVLPVTGPAEGAGGRELGGRA